MFNCLNRTTKFQSRSQLTLTSESEIIQQLTNQELIRAIDGSSFYRKHCQETANKAPHPGSKPHQSAHNPSHPADLQQVSRPELEQLYTKARNCACNSIIRSLYRTDKLRPKEVNHLYCRHSKFRLLARVRTNWESGDMATTADQRNFLSFSILSERNLSHFPGLVLYGYYSHLCTSMIGFISHIDADTHSYAENRLQLTENSEELLDIDDLLARTLADQTYCQISIASKYPDPDDPTILHPFLPDCIVCINKIDRNSRSISDQTGLPILLIHPSNQTFYRVHDFFGTPELAHPHIL